MQHTWSRLAASYALAPVSAKARAIAVLIGVALCVVAMGVAPRAGRTHLTRRGFSTRRSILRLIRCRRVGPVI